MEGTNRTMRLLWGFALAILIAALLPAGAVAAKPKVLKDAWGASLPELTYGTSVAVGPDGVPWFGVEDSSGPLLVSVEEDRLATDYLYGERRERPVSITSELKFDSEGNLWFVKRHGRGPETIVRRAVDGSLSESSVPAGDWVTSLAVGPGGEAWFAIDGKERQFGFIGPAGAITRLPLPGGVFPRSLVAGPDGAIWFVDGPYAKVGRVTAAGAVRLFPLGAGVAPGGLVAGSDGALWFSENGRRGRDGKRTARIGRVTTSGKVTQFPIPFGRRTEKLAATPQGRIWFSTDEGELSSISTSGAIGPHGCIHFSCRKPIVALAGGPDGSVWFAIAHVFETCGGCGGGAQLMLDNEGAAVGQIAAPRSDE
jgi:virginiamycin B lyase